MFCVRTRISFDFPISANKLNDLCSILLRTVKSASWVCRGNILWKKKEMHIIVTPSVYHPIAIRWAEMMNYVPILKMGMQRQITNSSIQRLFRSFRAQRAEGKLQIHFCWSNNILDTSGAVPSNCLHLNWYVLLSHGLFYVFRKYLSCSMLRC